MSTTETDREYHLTPLELAIAKLAQLFASSRRGPGREAIERVLAEFVTDVERGRLNRTTGQPFIATNQRIYQGARYVANAVSRTMAERIARALNAYVPSRKGK